jgi:hypothetical protein
MKILISATLLILLTCSLAGAQTKEEYRRKPFLVQFSLEPGLAFGELYDYRTGNPFQVGLRMGFYKGVSRAIALGFGGRFSTMPYDERFNEAYGFGLGPELLFYTQPSTNRRKIYCAFFARIIKQQALIYHDTYGGKISILQSKSGFEFGMRLGSKKPRGGLTYGLGMAYSVANDALDGYRLFLNIGYGL